MKLKLPSVKFLQYGTRHLVLFAICFLMLQVAQGQNKVLANQVTFESHVDNAINATLDNSDSATLNSYGGFLAGGGKYSGELELSFPSTIPANTTSYVRIDFDSDVLNSLLGGNLGGLLADVLGTVVLGNHYFNIQARKANGTPVLSYSSITPPQDERFRVVQDAAGNFYIAITPDQDYQKIYIQDKTDALLLGTTNKMEVYNAFYFNENQCNTNPLFTDFEGNGITLDLIDLGGAGVTHPEFVIDNDEDSFSEISLGVVGVLASIQQNVYFPAAYTPTTEFSITLKTDPALVTAGLLNNVEVGIYNGGEKVDSVELNSFLNLDLLTLLQNGQRAKIIFTSDVPFDKVGIKLTSLLNVNLAQTLDVYDVSIIGPAAPTTNENPQDFCLVDEPTIADIQVNEPNVIWYDMATGGTAYATTDALVDGSTYYASQVINGCEGEERLEVTVTVNDTPTPTTTSTDQAFCLVDNPTVADIQVNEPDVIWYDVMTGGTAYDPTDALVDGLTYYGAATGANGCESSVRLAVTVTVNDTPTPTTTSTDQDFCLVDNPAVADIQVNEPDVTWYDAMTGGTAYDPTDALVDGLTYYGAATGANGCESSVRLAVTVTVNDTPTPTTTSTDQAFCLVDNPTVADIQVNEPDVTWYDAMTGGTAYDPTDALVDGLIYYGAVIGANGCESSVRLAVTVTVNDTPTPTTTSTDQAFCLVDNPTVADIQVNEPDVTWYDAMTGGTAYDPTDALVDGLTYYGAATGANGCESSVRLAVTVTVNDTPTPTTTSIDQDFCLVDNPAVADIQVNEPDVTWYDAMTGGTAYDPTDALVDGLIYYGAVTGGNGCESSIRLAVTVTINDTDTPTTDNTEQGFCMVGNPMVSDLQADGPNIIWYDAPTDGMPYNPTDSLVDGQTYYASATGPSGCESSIRLAVTVTIGTGNDPTITSDAPENVCLNTIVTYTTESGNANYIWNYTGGALVDGGNSDDNFISIQWISIDNTTVSVSYDPLAPCATGATIIFNETVEVCADITITKTVNNPEPMVGENVIFTIEVNNLGPNDFSNLQISENIPSGYNLVGFEASIGTYVPNIGLWTIDILPANETAKLLITAEVLGIGDYLNTATIINSDPIDSDTSNNIGEVGVQPTCLFVYNQFSPNDDGVNDSLVISCIENYPNNSLKIFNRYGSLVYEKTGYKNSWDGRANVNNVSGKTDVLPSDTYYYILKIEDGAKPIMGWLFLIK